MGDMLFGELAATAVHPGGRTAAGELLAVSPTSLEALIATDPFAIEGLIDDMTVTEWDPIFGAFA